MSGHGKSKEALADLLEVAAQQWLKKKSHPTKPQRGLLPLELPPSLAASSLRVANTAAAGPDWACTLPRRLHFHLLRELRGERGGPAQQSSPLPPAVSDIGEALAAAMRGLARPLLATDDEKDEAARVASPASSSSRPLLCSVVFHGDDGGGNGVLSLTTTAHGRALLRRGLLPCPMHRLCCGGDCGAFLKGSKGLRMHLEAAHGLDYVTAAAATTAVVQRAAEENDNTTAAAAAAVITTIPSPRLLLRSRLVLSLAPRAEGRPRGAAGFGDESPQPPRSPQPSTTSSSSSSISTSTSSAANMPTARMRTMTMALSMVLELGRR